MANARDAKDNVAQRKADCIEHPEQLFASRSCPAAIYEMNEYLRGLQFADEPSYSVLQGIMRKLTVPPAEPPLLQSAAVPPAVLPQNGTSLPSSQTGPRPAVPEPTAAAEQQAARPRDSASTNPGVAAEPRLASRANYGGSNGQDQGAKRDKAASKECASERGRPHGRGWERHRRRSASGGHRSKSRERRSRSRGRHSRSPRERRRSKSRKRRVVSRSRSRERRPRSRSRTRSPVVRRDEREQRSSEHTTMLDKKYKRMRHFVGTLRQVRVQCIARVAGLCAIMRQVIFSVNGWLQGAISADGSKAAQQLALLPPAEAIGVACWYIDELSVGADPKHAAIVTELMDELAAFVAVSGKQCSDRTKLQ